MLRQAARKLGNELLQVDQIRKIIGVGPFDNADRISLAAKGTKS